ncbi:MAG: protein translocase subunit SecD [Candidatus Moranbacteria bacterium]|jgi:protein-export membrane protein SecD|nr:protein translocase subunit SecD [Candidatus Moranbacteria bacterium]MDX9855241.1 protein translocase subunit SecD [Candidatus Moranbacteria bacterium]
MSINKKIRLQFILVVFLAVFFGAIAYPNLVKSFPPLFNLIEKSKINLGLDLQGGFRLEYEADLSGVEDGREEDAIQAAQDVIERKANAFGVGEPLIQTVYSGGAPRIIVEFPGAKDVDDVKDKIGETPFLEFREEKTEEELAEEMESMQELFNPINEETKKLALEILEKAKSGEDFSSLASEYSQDPGSSDKGGDLDFVKRGVFVPEFDEVLFEKGLGNGEIYSELVETDFGWHIIKKIEERGGEEDREVHAQHILFAKKTPGMIPDLRYKSTELTGKNLKSSDVVFSDQGLSEPQVQLKFDGEGAKIFADITKRNIGKTVAIYLDGNIVSAPVVQTEILNGEAVITGNFTTEEAKELKRKLNEGALPVPIKLVSQQSVGASLGKISLEKSLLAGIYGLIVVAVFMIAYYRFFGLIAILALLIYSAMMISIFKLSGTLSDWPITLTLSGIAGFILSIGMAVDANILIFERIREELKKGRSLEGAINEGFLRAWPSIRDGNYSTIITSMILIWMGTGFIKGFAIVLIIGVLLSMFTAIVLVKIIMQFLAGKWLEKRLWLIIKK